MLWLWASVDRAGERQLSLSGLTLAGEQPKSRLAGLRLHVGHRSCCRACLKADMALAPALRRLCAANSGREEEMLSRLRTRLGRGLPGGPFLAQAQARLGRSKGAARE